jgi:aspartate aminotransferase-like enzyme
MHNEVTLGEIARRLADIDQRHSAQLDRIETQARITNGRTTRLEARVDGHDRDLKAMNHHQTSSDLHPEVRAIIERARDLQGASRVVKGMWAVGGALVPVAFWIWSIWK